VQGEEMNVPAFVQAENLTKVYTSGKIEVVALAEVNLAVGQGEFLGVTGPSGSGKSTLVNLLGGQALCVRRRELAGNKQFGVA